MSEVFEVLLKECKIFKDISDSGLIEIYISDNTIQFIPVEDDLSHPLDYLENNKFHIIKMVYVGNQKERYAVLRKTDVLCEFYEPLIGLVQSRLDKLSNLRVRGIIAEYLKIPVVDRSKRHVELENYNITDQEKYLMLILKYISEKK